MSDTKLLSKSNIELNDITLNANYIRLKEMIEELKEKNVRQEDFLLNISHDMRAHLNVIISVMQCIDYGSVDISDKKALEYMNIVKRNSFKMLKLINNLIDTTRLENNYYILNKKNIDIVSMIEGTISCIDRYAKQKNIQLIFDTNEEECIIAADPEVIDRIIMNLISNAIKFSPEYKNIFIDLYVSREEIQISVTDEGIGIPEDEQKRIFDRFYQIKKKKSNENLGSGIGLDLVNYLVKTHNGSIEIISKESMGTTFIVKLPITRIKETKEVVKRSSSEKIQMLEIEFSDIYLT
ncbi:sensor histidine kinase [Clostridium chauvoei]|uniref:histidine kinase n=3 Tax=Clostridium chauvoei TaxID=46867 RepID=A0A1U6IQA6_9CLOT|nr:HAMP domain-containing sensor histidine kinase [Clostridium chauvoei]ATD53772.1 two-component sensor histidine kinase [Clostridium chauvoei]MBX7281465.1 HAMP domain-containing histidine kinase [Clostridium chauvoei]MBX7283977.1 HAMP domain-containing histidine kinase [Clostridium chauvoei]MBX7286513.1 HAMP domain-containing histidine kinase [Clostridium chauvoei]MBX7289025.1 HAMP domain-containing histidine kinase [Clostridium chauvoei]